MENNNLQEGTNYWFRPKRFWNWFAAYYPVTWQGWLITIFSVSVLIKIFIIIDLRSHSASDTFISFAPWVIVIFLIFDILSFRKGEYPSWWRRKK